MAIYCVISASVDSNTAVWFYRSRDEAVLKYTQEKNSWEDVRLIQIFSKSVEVVRPEDGTVEDVPFGDEMILPF